MNNYLRNNLAGYKIFLQQIDNAIEWINADNYEDEEIELTEEEFAERIGIESVEVNADGSFTLMFDDDDIFVGQAAIAQK